MLEQLNVAEKLLYKSCLKLSVNDLLVVSKKSNGSIIKIVDALYKDGLIEKKADGAIVIYSITKNGLVWLTQH